MRGGGTRDSSARRAGGGGSQAPQLDGRDFFRLTRVTRDQVAPAQVVASEFVQPFSATVVYSLPVDT